MRGRSASCGWATPRSSRSPRGRCHASAAEGAYATTEGLPGTRNVWTGPETDDTRLVPDALAVARAGDTSRLGRLLAPMGIRYVVVSDQLAPAPFGGLARPADPVLGSLLSGQLDLEEVNVNPAMRVFRNVAWIPEATGLGSQSAVEDPVALDASAGRATPTVDRCEPLRRRPARRRPPCTWPTPTPRNGR